jgi:hypothetical protein
MHNVLTIIIPMMCREPVPDAAAGVQAAAAEGAAAAGVEVKEGDAAAVEVKQEGDEAAAVVKAEEQAAQPSAGSEPAAAAAAQPAPAEVKAEAKPEGAKFGAPAQGVDLGSFKLPADAVLKQEIPLPRRMASCVIGIKGQSVSKLRRESGSKIHVRPAVSREEMDQVVEIEGSIESVSGCNQSSGAAGLGVRIV